MEEREEKVEKERKKAREEEERERGREKRRMRSEKNECMNVVREEPTIFEAEHLVKGISMPTIFKEIR